MSHREKFAWLSLLAMTVTFGPYFVLAAVDAPLPGTTPDVELLVRFGVTAVAQMAILGVGLLVLRLRAPEGGHEPADERDRTIERRSMRIAYYVLIAGTILVGVIMPFEEAGGWAIVNAALAALILAELVHYGVAVWSYRRGWHD